MLRGIALSLFWFECLFVATHQLNLLNGGCGRFQQLPFSNDLVMKEMCIFCLSNHIRKVLEV